MAIPALNSSVGSRGSLRPISDITSLNSLLEILTLLGHSPKEGKPGEVDREGDDVEEDAQQVQHEAEQYCLFTLIY